MVPDDSTFHVRGLIKVYWTGAGERPGETLVLLGPSGSGKSTLLNILGGLDRATDGHVEFHGRDLTQASDTELTRYRRRSVGFIFQFFNLHASHPRRGQVWRQATGYGVYLRQVESANLAPLGALIRDRGEWAVYRIEQGRARLRPIRVGTLTDRDAEIRAGVNPGDQLIVYPSDQVQDGLRVRPRR